MWQEAQERARSRKEQLVAIRRDVNRRISQHLQLLVQSYMLSSQDERTSSEFQRSFKMLNQVVLERDKLRERAGHEVDKRLATAPPAVILRDVMAPTVANTNAHRC